MAYIPGGKVCVAEQTAGDGGEGPGPGAASEGVAAALQAGEGCALQSPNAAPLEHLQMAVQVNTTAHQIRLVAIYLCRNWRGKAQKFLASNQNVTKHLAIGMSLV